MGRRRTLAWLAGSAAIAGAIGGAGLGIALQEPGPPQARVAAVHRPNQVATLWEHRITPVAALTPATATEPAGPVTTSVEPETPTPATSPSPGSTPPVSPEPSATAGPSTTPAPSPAAATATGTPTPNGTPSPTAIPSPTATPSAPPAATPTPPAAETAAPPEDEPPPPPEPGEVLPGQLSALPGEVSRLGWVPAAFAGFPLSALIPPTYYARLTRSAVIDGTGEIATLRLSSYDLDAYSGTAGGKAWLTVDLYPAASANQNVTIIQPRGEIAGSLRLAPIAFPELTLTYWEAVSGRTPTITVSYQGRLADGRYVIVSGGASRPLAPRLVVDFIGVIESLQVAGQ